MEDCRSSSGSGRSNFCWIAKDSSGSRLECAGRDECRVYAEADWGNCKFASCAFDRAPNPYSERHKTCESMNANRLNTLKQECEDNSFDHWARIYNIPRKIYDKFEPCIGNGQIIEGETKKVISHCHCYNFCGETQTNNGDCVVQGLDRSLDKDADIRTTYTPMYVSIFLSISQYPLSLYFSNVFILVLQCCIENHLVWHRPSV